MYSPLDQSVSPFDVEPQPHVLPSLCVPAGFLASRKILHNSHSVGIKRALAYLARAELVQMDDADLA